MLEWHRRQIKNNKPGLLQHVTEIAICTYRCININHHISGKRMSNIWQISVPWKEESSRYLCSNCIFKGYMLSQCLNLLIINTISQPLTLNQLVIWEKEQECTAIWALRSFSSGNVASTASEMSIGNWFVSRWEAIDYVIWFIVDNYFFQLQGNSSLGMKWNWEENQQENLQLQDYVWLLGHLNVYRLCSSSLLAPDGS